MTSQTHSVRANWAASIFAVGLAKALHEWAHLLVYMLIGTSAALLILRQLHGDFSGMTRRRSVLTGYRLPSLQCLPELLSTYGLVVLFALVITGVILEELLYRGYLIERVSRIGRRDWLPCLALLFAFTVVHWRFVGFTPKPQKYALA